MQHPTTRDIVAEYAGRIEALTQRLPQPVTFMEVCGTHTVAIAKNGLRGLLPEKIRLVSGPGCPVCVSSQGYIEAAIELAARDGVTIATYGDMLRVPGRAGSLERARSDGADVRMVYSVADAVELARTNSDRDVVFLAVGFETTAPGTAWGVKTAAATGLENMFFFCSHKLILPAMKAICDSPKVQIDGFLCPGHVSVIIGSDAYKPLAADYGKPCVVGGFTPEQVMQAVWRLTGQVAEGKAEVGNVYDGYVAQQGNAAAQALFAQSFQVSDACWRGLGVIPEVVSIWPMTSAGSMRANASALSKRTFPNRLAAAAATCSAGRLTRPNVAFSPIHAPPRIRWGPAWSAARAPAGRISGLPPGKGTARE